MSVSSQPSKTTNGGKNIGLWLINIALAVAFVVVVWLRMPPAPEPAKATPPNPFENPQAGEAYIRKLAAQHGTNWDALSNDDRILLNSIAYGRGRDLLAKYAREAKEKPSGSGAPPAPSNPTP